jgi:hypothetical protein
MRFPTTIIGLRGFPRVRCQFPVGSPVRIAFIPYKFGIVVSCITLSFHILLRLPNIEFNFAVPAFYASSPDNASVPFFSQLVREEDSPNKAEDTL